MRYHFFWLSPSLTSVSSMIELDTGDDWVADLD